MSSVALNAFCCCCFFFFFSFHNAQVLSSTHILLPCRSHQYPGRARLRCSEQRITGVVNKLLPRSPPRVSPCRLLYVSQKAAIRSHNSPPLSLFLSLSLSLAEPGREALSVVSRHFAASAREDAFLRNAREIKKKNCKNWHRGRNICLHSNAGWSVESQGRCMRGDDERSSKTRSGSRVLAGNGASSARPAVIAFFLGKHLHILNKHN